MSLESDAPVQPLGPFKDSPRPENTGAPETPVPSESAAPPTDPGGATHYTTLEQADKAAREFQSKFDTAQAALQKYEAQLNAFGGLDKAMDLVRQVAAVSNRADFQAYMRGELQSLPPATDPDDEYLTEEQRELKELRSKVVELERGSQQRDVLTNTERAQAKFERAETEMRERYGEHWDSRRNKILAEVQQLGAKLGQAGLDRIDTALLNKAFLASFDSPQEYEEFATKWTASRDAARRAALPKGTTPPHQTAPTGVPRAPAKTMLEAFQRGTEEARDALANGRALN